MEKPKKKPTKIEEMTKEQIRQAVVKKRECNAKAQKIVESLLEKCVPEDFFLLCLPDINQCHFEDIVEERAIVHMCGYPLCQNTLSTKDIPKQKYRISLKTNKVYDITSRKSFCSNSCYKSATYIKRQMLTSPLWFRDYEEMPKFKLLPLDSVGSLGQEVDLGTVDRVKINSERHFTSINDFASATFNEMTEKDNENNNSSDTKNSDANNGIIQEKESLPPCENKHEESPLLSTHESTGIPTPSTQPALIETKTDQKKKPVKYPLNIVGDIIEKPEQKMDPILYETKTTTPSNETVKQTYPIYKKKQPVVTVLAIEVEKCLAEWFTIDTLLFLFGEEKVKEILADKGECIKEYLNNYANSTFYHSNNYDQYQALCRRLNMLELEDRKYDARTLTKETKPLPDYSILQEEGKKMQLKVRAFFSGETDIPDIAEVEPKPEVASEDDSRLTQLPPVDKNAQYALRRRIVYEHLNKVLPDILKSLGLLSLSISSEVRLLVNSFKLKANNIMFKPIQWTLIAIIVIKLLSLRDKRLEYLLEQQTAFQHLQLLLLSYKQDGSYLDRLISWLTDIDRLLDTNDTQFTV